MTLTALAIHAEAWLQEELGAQRALLAALTRVEAAARAGASAELERCGQELAELLAPAATRAARRSALLERLALALGTPAGELTLARLCVRLAAARVETERLQALRMELREVVAAGVKTGRRLATLARYHRGVLDELCQLFLAGTHGSEGHLVDARA